jgi:hypothetical protein
MGLTICVGLLAASKGKLESAQFRKMLSTFENLNTVLVRGGHVQHSEPLELPREAHFDAQMIGYGGLHYLRRMAAHLANNDSLPPPIKVYSTTVDDTEVSKLYDRLAKNNYRAQSRNPLRNLLGHKHELFAHLMLHSDSEGFYLPRDFEDVVFDDSVPQLEGVGGMVGSSAQLLRECETLAAAIELPPDLHHDEDILWDISDSPRDSGPLWQVYGIEAFGIARLVAACRTSLKYGSTVAFV